MGLIIKPTKEKNIVIKGTEITMPSVYGRIEFAGRADGKTLEVSISTFASKEAFKSEASVITTSVPMGNITVQIEESETQNIETAHKYAILAMNQNGFNCEAVKVQ